MINNKINYTFLFLVLWSSLGTKAQSMDYQVPWNMDQVPKGTLLDKMPNELKRGIDTYWESMAFSAEDIKDIRSANDFWIIQQEGINELLREPISKPSIGNKIPREFSEDEILNSFSLCLVSATLTIPCPLETDNYKSLHRMLNQLTQDSSKFKEWKEKTKRRRMGEKSTGKATLIPGSIRGIVLSLGMGNFDQFYIAKYDYRVDAYSKPHIIFLLFLSDIEL